MFYPTKDAFGTVPISVAFVSETETVSVASAIRCFVTVDEKHDVDDAVFLAQFRKK